MLKKAKSILQLIEAMVEAGCPPEYVYAAKRTGRIVVEDNIHTFTPHELEEWNQAIVEFHAFPSTSAHACRQRQRRGVSRSQRV
jgi:hypothetical protein